MLASCQARRHADHPGRGQNAQITVERRATGIRQPADTPRDCHSSWPKSPESGCNLRWRLSLDRGRAAGSGSSTVARTVDAARQALAPPPRPAGAARPPVASTVKRGAPAVTSPVRPGRVPRPARSPHPPGRWPGSPRPAAAPVERVARVVSPVTAPVVGPLRPVLDPVGRALAPVGSALAPVGSARHRRGRHQPERRRHGQPVPAPRQAAARGRPPGRRDPGRHRRPRVRSDRLGQPGRRGRRRHLAVGPGDGLRQHRRRPRRRLGQLRRRGRPGVDVGAGGDISTGGIIAPTPPGTTPGRTDTVEKPVTPSRRPGSER
jgi:hypothetical protein